MMSRKKKGFDYRCIKCEKVVCTAEYILNDGLCVPCKISSNESKPCYKCGSPMKKKMAFDRWYWYCNKCMRGYPIDVSEGNSVVLEDGKVD